MSHRFCTQFGRSGIACAVLLSASLAWAALAPAHAADIKYVYDENGRLVEVVTADGSSAQYRYDAVGNINTIKKNAATTLSIAEFTPNGGMAGSAVTLYGNGFNAIAANNVVKFNGIAAPVSTASATSLTTVVPAGASTGKISVSNPNGSATTATDFVVGAQLAPTITSFTPSMGSVGTNVTISGTNFQSTKTNNKISFGGMAAATTAAAPDSLGTTVPRGAASGKIIVTTPYGKASSGIDFYAIPNGINAADIEYTGRIDANGTVKTVTINNPGKKALLIFDGSQLQYLSLMSSGGTFGGGVSVAVCKPDGTVLSSGNISNNGAIDFAQLPAAATYTILLSPAATDHGKFDLQLKTEANATLAIDGTPLSVTLGAGQNGRYTFNGTAGQTLGLGYTGVGTTPAGQSINYQVENPNGTVLVSTVTPQDGSNNLPRLPVTGTYSIVVNPQESASANVTLTLSSDRTGTLTADGAATTFSTARPGQNGRYTFSGGAGQKHWMVLMNGTFTSGARITVFKPDGTELISTGVNAASIFDIPALPLAGTYTVFTDPSGAATGKVDMQLKTTPGDKIGAITIDGAPLQVDLIAGQKGMITFSGAAGQTLGLGYTGVGTTPAGQGIAYIVRKPDGTVLASNNFSSNGSASLPPLPAAGPYTIELQASTNGSAGFTLTLSSDLTGTLTVDGAAATFSTARPGQNGRYTFSAAAGQEYWIVLTNGTFASGARITVFKPDGPMTSTSMTDESSLDIWALPQAGTYTVLIDPSGAATGKVDLQLKTIPNDKTGGIAVDGAPLQVDLILHQKGMITFNGMAGQTLGLGYTGVGTMLPGQGVVYTVRRPDYTMLTIDMFTSNGSVNLPPLPATGLYTIELRGIANGSAGFTLTLSSDLVGTLTANAASTTFSTARPGQNGRYTFSGSAGQKHSMVLTNSTFALGASITILKPDGTALISNSVSTASTFDIPALPLAGTYTVLIDPSGAATGKVDLQLKTTSGDKTGTIAVDGTPLQVDLIVHQKGVITFNGAAGQTLGLGYTGVGTTPAGQSIAYKVRRPDGTVLTSNNFSSNGSANLPPLPAAGPYTIELQASSDGSAGVTLILSSDIAGTLTADGAATTFGTARPGQNGRYTFNGGAGQKHSMVLTNAAFTSGASITILKPDGTALISSSVNAASIFDIPALPQTGTYTVFIDPSGTATGKVDLQLKTTPGDKIGAIIIDDAPLQVDLIVHQKGRITFNGATGQTLGLGYTGVGTTPTGQGIAYSIRKPDGTVLISNTFSSNGSVNLPRLPAAGAYTIELQAGANGSAGVTLTLSSDLAGTLTADAAATTFSTARPGQNGRYTFSGGAGQKHWMVLTNGTFASGARITVLKPDGTALTWNSMSAAGTFDIPALPLAGTYTVFIDPSGAATGKIDLQLKTTPDDKTGGIAVDGAPLQVDLIVHQKGMITFDGAAGQTLGLGYTGVGTTPTGQSIAFRLRKPDATVLTSNSFSSNGGANLPPLPAAGTYSIELQTGSNGSAGVTLTLSSDLAGTLTAGTTATTFRTARPGQNGRYTFSGDAGQQHRMTLANGTFASGAGVTVFKPDGAVLISRSVSAATTVDIPALPVAGNYTVFVDPYGAATGSVDIQLK